MLSNINLLQLIQDPKQLLGTAVDEEQWQKGLEITKVVTANDVVQLRDAQEAAWKGMTNDQIGLLLGPPGTGKTFTISAMACGLMSACVEENRPCRIFVTGFTRNSIQNVLEYIKDFSHKYPQLRFELAYDQDALVDKGINHVEDKDFHSFLEDSHSIFGGTIWTLFRILKKKTHLPKGQRPKSTIRQAPIFDFVIIDEASQLQFSYALMAMAGMHEHGRVLICGDNNQLAPIFDVEVELNDTFGNQSVYDFLVAHDFPEFALNETFRLNAPLVDFVSKEYYGGNYISAEPIQNRKLKYQKHWRKGVPEWKQAILDPNIPFVVLIHDGEEAAKKNPTENEIVHSLVKSLYDIVPSSTAFWEHDLAVISPHKRNNEHLRETLGSITGDSYVDTVDRFQGRERDCIIYSMCVSDPEFAQNESGFLFSPNRVNVAITRARSKLILIVSKKILHVMLKEEEHIEALHSFRKLVFSGKHIGDLVLETQKKKELTINIYGTAFQNTDIDFASQLIQKERTRPNPSILNATPSITILNGHLQKILQAIQNLYKEEEKKYWYNVRLNEVVKKLEEEAIEYCFDDFIKLFQMGNIYILKHDNDIVLSLNYKGDTPVQVTVEDIRIRIMEILYSNRHKMEYTQLMKHIVWMNNRQEDLLWPILEDMAAYQQINFEAHKTDANKKYVVLNDFGLFNRPKPAPNPPLEQSDYEILNAIEDKEVSWINFGIVEYWITEQDLFHLGYSKNTVSQAIPKLIAHGHLMRVGRFESKYRSRMAEMARSIRYVKQRFAFSKVDESPLLVRSMKVIVKNRTKPSRENSLFDVLGKIEEDLSDPIATQVCTAFASMFREEWGENACISRFQKDSWNSIFKKWLNRDSGKGVVITADTGAGKTEATCIPIIMGAMYDQIHQSTYLGCQAILIYPRVRLANNQAQRLTHYLKRLHDQGLPLLTIGLQTGGVLRNWDNQYNSKIWVKHDDSHFVFPFFKCPACQSELLLEVDGGEGKKVDKLICRNKPEDCGWEYSGWVGTQDGVRTNPPSLFLPTADSLHQWLQNEYKESPGNIFGDLSLAPPKAILADEIHLYSMIFGAQFAYTIRRTLFRLQSNTKHSVEPLAIGMSATLSAPLKLWSDLTGIRRESITHIQPREEDQKINPVGREYYYFVQPEVESRGKDIASSSTTIQTSMLLAHNMRRRTEKEGGYRSVIFMDSIDKIKRLNLDFKDAEENKKLASLRVKPKGRHCCGDPTNCQTFEKGECWYFAGTDTAQWTASGRYLVDSNLQVSQPISSQLKSNAEDMIHKSDILFATSSLEVGFDDPDMMMVYQHYAPSNLASFVQRKGRGGRGADDRPITGVTLSLFSPTDVWYFRHPERMLDAKSFNIPINTSNYFVKRGQVIAFFFDLLMQQKNKDASLSKSGVTLQNCLSGARNMMFTQAVKSVFGLNIFEELEAKDMRDFWNNLTKNKNLRKYYQSKVDGRYRYWRDFIDETCTFLSDPISLPALSISFSPFPNGKTTDAGEEIAFAFSELSPGKISYRWGHNGTAHWNPYQGNYAPMFPAGTKYTLESLPTEIELPNALKKHSGDIQMSIFRPTSIQTQVAGQNERGQWKSGFKVTSGSIVPKNRDKYGISHKSTSTLLGTLLIERKDETAVQIPLDTVLMFSSDYPKIFKTSPRTRKGTGLIASQIYWGADVQLVEQQQKKETYYLRTIFSQPSLKRGEAKKRAIYGYQLHTEGVSIPLDATKITSFIQKYTDKLNKKWERYHRQQFFQYRLMQKGYELQLNSYELQMLTTLISAGFKMELTAKSLMEEIRKPTFDASAWSFLLQQIYEHTLSASATISERRIDKLLESIVSKSSDKLQPILRRLFAEVQDKDSFTKYLSSTLMHSMAIRLKQLVVRYGQGDDRRLLFHVKLPLEYQDIDHHLTVLELGSFGDGTTRTFESFISDAFDDWQDNGVITCQNAKTDQVLAYLLENLDLVKVWKDTDQEEIKSIDFQRRFARRLRLNPEEDGDIIQLCIRLIFQSIDIGGHQIQYFDVFQEIQLLKKELEEQTARMVSADELITFVLKKVLSQSGQTPYLQTLLKAYHEVYQGSMFHEDDSLAPEKRLTNQIYQISGSLCQDGCQACLHLGSNVLPHATSNLVTSRRILSDYWRFVTKETKKKAVAKSQPKGSQYAHDKLSLLFPQDYLALVNELNNSGMEFSSSCEVLGKIQLGGTSFHDVVVGSYLTKIRHKDTDVYLVPEDQKNLDAVREYLNQRGHTILVSQTDSMDYVLQQLTHVDG